MVLVTKFRLLDIHTIQYLETMSRVRAQCIAVRDGKILMVRHSLDGREWWVLPGGGVQDGETFEEAAIREMYEECNVKALIIRKTSEVYDDKPIVVTFLVEIGDQKTCLGEDPELREQSLIDVKWLKLDEIPERDRAFVWAAGLLTVPGFYPEVESWGDSISYPNK